MKMRATALVLIGISAVFVTSVAMASSPQMEAYGDWTVRCIDRENLPPCDIAQATLRRESGEQVLEFSIAYAGANDAYGVLLITPLGVGLTEGAAIRVDDRPALDNLKFTRCESRGCFIEAIVEPKALKPLQGGEQGVLVLVGRDNRPQGIPLSLNGFSKALGVMRARNLKWAERPRT